MSDIAAPRPNASDPHPSVPRAHMADTRDARRLVRFRLSSLTAALVVVVLLAFLSLTTVLGQGLDTLIMYSVQAQLPFHWTMSLVLNTLVSVPVLLGTAAVMLIVILWQRKFSLLWRIFAVLVSANATTQLLKLVLTRPELGVGHSLPNSFPSGHVTLVAGIGMALIAAAPPKWRGIATLVAWATTCFVGIAVMDLGWHRLSDVLGAILVTTIWAFVWLPSTRNLFHPSPRDHTFAAVAWGVLTAGIIGNGLVAWHLRGILAYPIGGPALQIMGEAGFPGRVVAVLAVAMVTALVAIVVYGVTRLVEQ